MLVIQPRHSQVVETSLSILAVDGYPLAATRFSPSNVRSRRLVVINGATGVPHRFYRHFATYLADAGLDVISYDYRGIGASRHGQVRDLDATMTDWGTRDFDAVLRYARETLGHDHVALVGHSVGGQLIAFADGSRAVNRIVGVASQVADYRLWPWPTRVRNLAIMGVVVPAIVKTLGYLPARFVGEALPRGVALEWARWCTTAGYFTTELSEIERGRFRQFSGELLAYSIEEDPFATPAAVDAWCALFTTAATTRRHLDDAALGHFGFFKPGRTPHAWDEVRAFLER
jgi:predicted alpha/beta hydrolase